MKIVNLTEKDKDAKRFTPEQALQVVLDEYKKGINIGKKIIIVTLNDTDNACQVEFFMAGVHGQEAVSILEAAKYLILKETFE